MTEPSSSNLDPPARSRSKRLLVIAVLLGLLPAVGCRRVPDRPPNTQELHEAELASERVWKEWSRTGDLRKAALPEIGRLGGTRRAIWLLRAYINAPRKKSQAGKAIPAMLMLGCCGEKGLEEVKAFLGHKHMVIDYWVPLTLGNVGGPRVIPWLVEVIHARAGLTSERATAATTAIQALGRLGQPAFEPLVKLLKHGSSSIRGTAAHVLGLLGEPAVEPLAGVLNGKDEESVRKWAARGLGKTGSAKAVAPLLVAAQGDEVQWIRVLAIRALGKLKASEAVPVLIGFLEKQPETIRIASIGSLGEIGDFRATDPLMTIAASDSDPHRMYAMGALGKLGAPRGAPLLVKALGHDKYKVRKGAEQALRIMGTPATDALMAGLNSPKPDVIRKSSLLLGELKERRAVPKLINLLSHISKFVRSDAAKALGMIGPQAHSAVPRLEEAINDQSIQVAEIAARALGEIGDPHAVDALTAALNHKSKYVRQAAAEALRKIRAAQPKQNVEK